MSLDQKAAQVQPAERVYEDFEPPHDWVHDETSDTLILMLPGFRREQLRVQIASTRILRLSGERQMSGNKWRQFRKEFPIPQESDTNGVSAKFENGILYIKLPKLITPIKPTPTPTPTPQQQAPRPPQLPTQQETPKPPQQPTPPNAQEAKTEKISKPPTPTPTPTPIAPQQESKVDEESQKKPKPADKAVETKAEKAEEAPAATPAQVAPLQKNEVDDSQKKAQKEKGKSEATTSKAHHHQGVHEAKIDKRSQTLELLSRQTQEYTSAVYGLVEELKKQKKLANLLVGIFLAFVFGLYVKHAIKSSFGGPKIEEL